METIMGLGRDYSKRVEGLFLEWWVCSKVSCGDDNITLNIPKNIEFHALSDCMTHKLDSKKLLQKK